MTTSEQSDVQLCKCGKNPASEEGHPCPFQVDVNNDSDFRCHCCPECRQVCQDDV